jgi:3-hydroxymyristoyl/3-hydroxydecanoyl-(acyl carrier protein) dehydratase
MAEHFSAFTFIDRITGLEPGRRARAQFLVPPALSGFPPSLAAEAVGQLACWVAMAQTGFRRRPVAGIVGQARLLGAASPGDRLDLSAELGSCDDEAMAYEGRAEVGGRPVVVLAACVGPMLPMEDFDAPEAVAAQCALFCGPGAPPGRFPGVTPLGFAVTGGEPGRHLQAALQIPAAAPFFADHFPRRPVVPGTLLLDAQLRLAAALAAEASGGAGPPQPRLVQNVKLRSFIAPGQCVELRAELAPAPEGAIRIGARLEGRVIGSGLVRMTAAEAP